MTCHLCEAPLDDAPIVGRRCREGREQIRKACTACGLVQVVPLPSAEEVEHYYTSGEYWREHPPVQLGFSDGRVIEPSDPGYAEAVASMHRNRAKMVVGEMGLTPDSVVIEYGSGKGELCAELQRLGLLAYGLDLDTNVSRHDSPPLYPKCTTAVIAFHMLEHLHSPLGWLVQKREQIETYYVFFEVPDVLCPRGSRKLEEWHFQWAHLYEFSVHTLGAVMHRAGFDDIEVTAAHGVLRVKAVDRDSAPRPYAPHGGPDGEQVAKVLKRYQASTPTAGIIARVVAGELDVGPHTAALRAELILVRDGQARIAQAYEDLTESVGALSVRCDDGAIERLESWHPDGETHSHAIGEAMGLWTMKSTLANLANAARLKKLRDGAQ